MAEAQNFRISVRNLSGMQFIAGDEKMKHGGVYEKRNIENNAKSKALFYTRGDKDAAAGTEGSITYKSDEATINFEWYIPWGLGENRLTVSTTGDIKIEKKIWKGDEVLRKTIEIVIYYYKNK